MIWRNALIAFLWLQALLVKSCSTSHLVALMLVGSEFLKLFEGVTENASLQGGEIPTWVASFPGLPAVQFLIACSMQKRRGKVWSILSHIVYLGRQRGGGGVVPNQKEYISHTFFAWNSLCFSLCDHLKPSAWDRNYKIRSRARFFNQAPLPPMST